VRGGANRADTASCIGYWLSKNSPFATSFLSQAYLSPRRDPAAFPRRAWTIHGEFFSKRFERSRKFSASFFKSALPSNRHLMGGVSLSTP